MKSGLLFDSVVPVWVVYTTSVIVFLFFCWLEWRNKPNYLFGRIAALALMMFGIIGLIVQPYYYRDTQQKGLLVVTSSAPASKIDSIANQHQLEVLLLGDSLQHNGATTILSLDDLSQRSEQIHHVVGNGLPVAFLQNHPSLSYSYVPVGKPVGFTTLEIPELKAGLPTLIRGKYITTDSVRIAISGPGGAEDSTWIGPAHPDFALQIRPKQSGQYVYDLSVKTGTTTRHELLPLSVDSIQTLRILLLQKFPTFETRYLKNFLADQGHALTLRYAVSKNTFRFEYANESNKGTPRISRSSLREFDLLVLTSEQAEDLSSSERVAVREAVDEGLGLLYIVAPLQAPPLGVKSIFPFEMVATKADTVTLSHFSWRSPVKLPHHALAVRNNATVESIWQDEQSNLLAGVQSYGLGRIGFQFLSETFSLALEGRNDQYAQLWTPILSGTARARSKTTQVSLPTFPLFVNQLIPIDLLASHEKPELYLDGEWLPLREDEFVDDWWHTVARVQQPGWHQLQSNNSESFFFYAHPAGAWSNLAAHQQHMQNLQHHTDTANAIEVLKPVKQAISPLWFFVLFLLAAGFLWLSPKL